MHRFEQRRERIAVLHAGRRDLAFDGKTKRIDGQMTLAAFDLLARVKTTRPAAEDGLELVEVSPLVNKTANDGPELQAPLGVAIRAAAP